MDAPPEKKVSPAIGCAFIAGGFILFLFSSTLLIGLVYGVDRRDSSAVWGLSGAWDFIFSILFSPIYFILYPILHSFLRRRNSDIGMAELHSMIASAVGTAIVVCIAWGIAGYGRVLKAG